MVEITKIYLSLLREFGYLHLFSTVYLAKFFNDINVPEKRPNESTNDNRINKIFIHSFIDRKEQESMVDGENCMSDRY